MRKSTPHIKQPTLRAVNGVVKIVDPDGFVMHIVKLDEARAMQKRKEIVPVAKQGFARINDALPLTTATPEEIAAIKRRVELRREREKAERRGRRTKR